MADASSAIETSEPAPVDMLGAARASVDIVGPVPAPSAFAMPRVAPLEKSLPPVDPAAGQPAERPDAYQATGSQTPLDRLVPRTGSPRDPHAEFRTTASVSEWGHSRSTDPHSPIVTSSGSSSMRPRQTWAPPQDQAPVEVQSDRPAFTMAPAAESGLFGELPEVPGNRSLGALCRASGWGLAAVLVVGCLSTWLSFPALVVAWYFAWRHPVSRTNLLRAFTPASAAVLLLALIGSPTRTGWQQLGWASWIADICLLCITLLISDRRLTPSRKGYDSAGGRDGTGPADGRESPRR